MNEERSISPELAEWSSQRANVYSSSHRLVQYNSFPTELNTERLMLGRVQNEINSVKEETNNKIGMDDQEERKGVEAISAFEQQHAQALKLKNLSTLETVREIAEMQVEVLCKFCKNYYLVPVHRKALSSSLLRCGIIWTVCCLGWIFCCFCKENVTFCPHCQRALDGKSYFLQD